MVKETLSGGSYTQSTLASGLSCPFGVAVDGSGNIYIANIGSNSVVKQDYADALSFASTTVGQTSSDSPQTVMLTNIGNAALTPFFLWKVFALLQGVLGKTSGETWFFDGEFVVGLW